MSSSTTPLDQKSLAAEYSDVAKINSAEGNELVASLGLKCGMKVLDMGCGTGETTSFIADLVGEQGHVVGVDPDAERIKVAIRKCSGRANISFHVGDSSSNFPHFNKVYYDVHFSNYVFQFVPLTEKATFLETAHRCLKIGGLIVIHSRDCNNTLIEGAKDLLPDDGTGNTRIKMHVTVMSDLETMLRDLGFVIECSEYDVKETTFESVDSILTWIYVALKLDKSKVLPEKKQDFAKKFAKEDGTVTIKKTVYKIIAKKL